MSNLELIKVNWEVISFENNRVFPITQKNKTKKRKHLKVSLQN